MSQAVTDGGATGLSSFGGGRRIVLGREYDMVVYLTNAQMQSSNIR